MTEKIPDTLLLLEHPPVVTLGKRGRSRDLLLSRELFTSRGVEIAEIDRGGQVTYHGPGQLVGYIIANLYHHQRKLKLFVRRLEESVILYLRRFHGIEAGVSEEHVGVWTGNEKIAALGISISRGVTMHGFALNINCDPGSLWMDCPLRYNRPGSNLGSPEDRQRNRYESGQAGLSLLFSAMYMVTKMWKRSTGLTRRS